MTTQVIEETESAGDLEDSDLLVLFRPGQDDEIRKAWATIRDQIADLSVSKTGGTAHMYIRFDADGAVEEVSAAEQIDATGGLPEATSALEGHSAVDKNTEVAYICVNRPHRTSEATGTWANIATRSDLTIAHSRFDVTPTDDQWLYENSTGFFYEGAIVSQAPERIEWIQDVADDALASSLSDVNNVVHYLYHHDADSEALALMTTLADGTEYFYFDTRNQVFRILDNDTFVAAGTPLDHFSWRVLKADERILVIIDGREGAHPIPSDGGEDDQRIRLTNNGLQTVRITDVASVAATGDWTDYTDANYRGAFASNPNSPLVNEFYYNTVHHRWMHAFLTVGTLYAWFVGNNVADWLDHFSSQDAAVHDRRAEDGSVAWTGSAVQVLSNYVAPTVSHTDRAWDLTGVIPAMAGDDYITAMSLSSANLLTITRRLGGTVTLSLSSLTRRVTAGTYDAATGDLTLEYDNGTTFDVDLSDLRGADIASGELNDDHELILTKVDGTTLDAIDLSTFVTDTSEQGSAQIGNNHWQHILWQQKDTEPDDPTVTWGDGGWSAATPTPWYRGRSDAEVAGTADPNVADDAPFWIAYSKTTKSSGGNYSMTVWSIVQEFGVQYSEDAEDWHNVQTNDDMFMRFRLANGDLSPSVRIASDLSTSAWVELHKQVCYGGYGSNHFGIREDCSGYNEIRIDFHPFARWIDNVAHNYGVRHTLIIYRPRDGWNFDFNDNNTAYSGFLTSWVEYSEANGVVNGYFDSATVNAYTLQPTAGRTYSVGGTNVTVPIITSWYFKFISNSSSAPEYMYKMRNFDFTTSWQRVELTIYGR